MKRRPHIRRVDRSTFHGWAVTLRRGGQLWTSYFRDRGRDEALARALAYRDSLLGRSSRLLGRAQKSRPVGATPPQW